MTKPNRSKAGIALVWVILLMIIAGGTIAVLAQQNMLPKIPLQVAPQQGQSQQTIVLPGGQTTVLQQQTVVPAVAVESGGTAQLRFTVSDGIDTGTKLTTTNTILTIIKDGNYKSADDSIAVDSATETSRLTYSPGSNLELWVASDVDGTNGEEYYMAAYTINPLAVGTPITNKMTGVTAGKVGFYKAGDASYWELGNLYVNRRAQNSDIDLSINYQGTTASSITDGTSFDDTQSEQNADFTLASNSETFYIEVNLGAKNIAWGTSYYTLSSDAEPKLQKRELVLWISFNRTGVVVEGEGLPGRSWVKLSTQPTGWVSYAIRLPEIASTTVQQASVRVAVPVRTDGIAANVSTAVYVWASDGQIWEQATSGQTTTSAPSRNGALAAANSISPDDINYARAYSVNSSDVPQNPILFADMGTQT